ncbi:MAG TPA: hypothetical protein VMU48_01895 [Terracidiphilus sp.]|nr:hypothetical protein [Terracidiphilus sp.]
MFSFRRLVLLVAFTLPAAHILPAQDSNQSAPAPQTPQPQQQEQPATTESSGQTSVQARIRARREQRRAQAIHDTYAHLYEVFVGAGYLRFTPGPNLQRVTMYSWDAAITRYFSERLGVTVDGRGYYGTPYVGLNTTGITRPAISQYDVMGGPTYRFRLRPRYSLAARAMGGVAMGNFSGDTSGFSTSLLGLYPDSDTYVISGAIIGEANVSPNLSLRLAGEDLATGFGSSLHNSFGFQYGFVYRFGKQ